MGLKWQGKSVFRSHHSFLAYVIAQAHYDRTGELKFSLLILQLYRVKLVEAKPIHAVLALRPYFQVL